MVRKWLAIGINIIAVVLLVLDPLSNVVECHSVEKTVDDSPLFQTRSQRATNQQQVILTAQYLGMEKENLLRFPIKENRTIQLKKFFEAIYKMNDRTFGQVIELCIRNIKHRNNIKDINPSELLQFHRQLKTASGVLNDFMKENNSIEPPSLLIISFCRWAPGCLLLCLYILMILTVVFVYDSFVGDTLCGGTCAAECSKALEMKDFYYFLNEL